MSETEPAAEQERENYVREGGIEMAVLRKLVYQLAETDADEASLMEAALLAVERMDDLEQRVSELEGATGINLENAEYKTLSRAAKIDRIRSALKEEASDTNGYAAMGYNEVMALFDYHPSPGHASQLVKAAAGFDEQSRESSRPGFEFEQHEDRNNRVTVDLEKTA